MITKLCPLCHSTLTLHHDCGRSKQVTYLQSSRHIDYQCHFVEKGVRCILPGKVSSSRYQLMSWFCKEHWKQMQFSKK